MPARDERNDNMGEGRPSDEAPEDAEASAGGILAGGVLSSTVGAGGPIGSVGAAAAGAMIARDLVDEENSAATADPDSDSAPDSYAGGGTTEPPSDTPGGPR